MLPKLPDVNKISSEQYRAISVEIATLMIKTLYPFPKNVRVDKVTDDDSLIEISGMFAGREGIFDFKVEKNKTTSKMTIDYGLKKDAKKS